MPLLHCSKCHHEWESVQPSGTCDWCGAASVRLTDAPALESAMARPRRRDVTGEFMAAMREAATGKATPPMEREVRLAALEDEVKRLRQALQVAAAPLPSTKGMAPADRAERLHAEMDRRMVAARRALDNPHAARPTSW